MAEIPYFFETPIPKYFRENGWYSNPNTILFLTWAFARCSNEKRTIVYDHKEITLEPFEFITGRGKSSVDSLLTEEAFRHQLISMQKAGLLKKTPNSTPNRFTCFVWAIERFSKIYPQLNSQLTPNSPPTEPPQSRRKKTRSKEDHPSIPSNQNETIDDFSSESNKKNLLHNIHYQILPPKDFVEIISGVFISQNELDACIKIKGDIERVKQAIEYVQNSKKRKYPITDWPNTLAKWKIEDKTKVKIEENLAYAEKIFKSFGEFKFGWLCRHYKNKIKDQAGVLFEPSSPYMQPFFIAYADAQFKQKCNDFMREKKMIS